MVQRGSGQIKKNSKKGEQSPRAERTVGASERERKGKAQEGDKSVRRSERSGANGAEGTEQSGTSELSDSRKRKPRSSTGS